MPWRGTWPARGRTATPRTSASQSSTRASCKSPTAQRNGVCHRWAWQRRRPPARALLALLPLTPRLLGCPLGQLLLSSAGGAASRLALVESPGRRAPRKSAWRAEARPATMARRASHVPRPTSCPRTPRPHHLSSDRPLSPTFTHSSPLVPPSPTTTTPGVCQHGRAGAGEREPPD